MRTIEYLPDGARLRIDLDTDQFVYVPANAESLDDCEWFDTLQEARTYIASL